MATGNLTWNGPAISEKMRAAQIVGVNRTMGACVNHAKRNHPWKNRSGILEGGINLVAFAAVDGAGVKGTWGVNDVRYALALEIGAVIKPVKAKALAIPQPDGSVRFAKSVTIPAMPYLRPAADAIYPSLAARIRRAYEGDAGGDRDG